MPQDVVMKINQAVQKALETPEAIKILRNSGFTPASGTPDQFRDKIADGVRLWGKVAHDAGVKPE
jgi:tripartite-type tricarboxylate transporter receptor subunit TctC